MGNVLHNSVRRQWSTTRWLQIEPPSGLLCERVIRQPLMGRRLSRDTQPAHGGSGPKRTWLPTKPPRRCSQTGGRIVSFRDRS